MKHKPIGIFGGTFDPIHLGHIHAADEVQKLLSLRDVRLIPCHTPAHREPPQVSAEDRLAMVKLAVSGYDKLIADDRELKRSGTSYMLDTLQSLRDEFGDEQSLCLILAADAFSTFTSWHRWQEIPKVAHIIIANRADYTPQENTDLINLIKRHVIRDPEKLQQQAANCILPLNIRSLPISATQIRATLRAGKNPDNMLDKKVLNYITEHELYKKQ